MDGDSRGRPFVDIPMSERMHDLRVLQRVSVFCCVLRRVVACCSRVLDGDSRGRPFVDIPMSGKMHVLQCAAACYSVLRRVAACCSVLQGVGWGF